MIIYNVCNIEHWTPCITGYHVSVILIDTNLYFCQRLFFDASCSCNLYWSDYTEAVHFRIRTVRCQFLLPALYDVGPGQWSTGIPVPVPGRCRDWTFCPGPGKFRRFAGILTGIIPVPGPGRCRDWKINCRDFDRDFLTVTAKFSNFSVSACLLKFYSRYYINSWEIRILRILRQQANLRIFRPINYTLKSDNWH